MQKYLKLLRVFFSIILLAGMSFLFLDFTSSTGTAWYRRLTYLSFVPSLDLFIQSLIHGLALTAWGWLAVLILTLLFGRIYCSFLCPLGVLQDIISFLSRKSTLRKRPFRYKYSKPLNWVRYPILIITLVSLAVTGTLLVNLLDPYSHFGRIMADLFRPVYIYGNNLLATLLEKAGSYLLYPVDIIAGNPLTLIVPVIVLILLLSLATTQGRMYCNSVCPVGTTLGLISGIALFRPTIDKTACTKCGQCVQKCKAQCINIKAQKIDNTRCVGCFNCVRICDTGALRYRLTLPGKSDAQNIESDPEDMETVSKVAASGLGPMAESILKEEPEAPRTQDTDRSKRRFIAESVTALVALSGLEAWADEDGDEENKASREDAAMKKLKAERRVPVCPPGSLSLRHFTYTCTACHLCVSACPTGVLRPTFLEYGLIGIGQPRMDYNTSFCNQNCTRCGEVCPTGAILPLTAEQKTTVQIGRVNFIAANCTVTKQETACGSCAEHCPTKAVRMVPYKGFLTIPSTDTSLCLGCGACQFACPVPEKNAIFVLSNREHLTAVPPEEEVIEYEEQTEFPF
ncbi:MAG: 4Fe-4S binding protein [Bacteroidales bacterium]|nr:4Fe-4S binding protein [Bacteroidales bacterium]